MNNFITLTMQDGNSCVVNINHIVAYYADKGSKVTVLETDSTFEDGRFIVKEPVHWIFDAIDLIQRGGIL